MRSRTARLGWTEANAVRLLQNGTDFFPALCKAIEGAQFAVHLETYIFRLDRTGINVLECLENAARRGVKVRLVLDGFGSQQSAAEVSERLRAVGGQCRIYRPEPSGLGRLVPMPRRLRRMHRKVAVMDAQVAIVGGINVMDDDENLDPRGSIVAPRFDFAVEVRGPLVAHMVHAQNLMWIELKRGLRRRLKGDPPINLLHCRYEIAASAGGTRAAFVLRDNTRYRHTFERAYLYGLRHAQHDILIANAYFLPGRRFRKALMQAAVRGVRVRLLLQGKVEYRMQYYATQSLYGRLLRSGIEIYEYMPSYLHAKVGVIDNVATVGSSNLDPFSLLLAREANVLVDDKGFTGELQRRLETAIITGGKFIRQVEYHHQGWVRRCIVAVSYMLLRIGVMLTGQSHRY